MADWLSWRRGMALTERAASVINARKVSEKLQSILIYLLAYLNFFNLALYSSLLIAQNYKQYDY